MRIEVVFAITSREWSVEFDCDEGTTVGYLVESVAKHEDFADAPLATAGGYAIWGELVDLDHELVDGDRLEILRNLIHDPMELRRANAFALRRP